MASTNHRSTKPHTSQFSTRIEQDEDYVLVSVRAYDTETEAESAVDYRVIQLARIGITLASPTV